MKFACITGKYMLNGLLRYIEPMIGSDRLLRTGERTRKAAMSNVVGESQR